MEVKTYSLKPVNLTAIVPRVIGFVVDLKKDARSQLINELF